LSIGGASATASGKTGKRVWALKLGQRETAGLGKGGGENLQPLLQGANGVPIQRGERENSTEGKKSWSASSR